MKRYLDQKGFVGIPEIVLIVIIMALAFYAGYRFFRRTNNNTDLKSSSVAESNNTHTWQAIGAAIKGKYADADIVSLGGSRYRMYYSIEPEVSGNQLQAYSAVSTDGLKWTKEAGIRKKFAPFPSVLKLPNGKWRMYFQNEGVIKSALSSDGLNWADEAGVRVDTSNSLGLKFDNVAAPTVERLKNGQYLMVYRGLINTAYSNDVPNNSTQLFLWATSNNGLDWKKQGVAIDSRNSLLQGLADGPELVPAWDDGTTRLFFWSYQGIYESIYKEGKFSKPMLVFQAQNANATTKYPQNPPGDPTVININNAWYLFYGQHTKGIYAAILK